MTACSAILFACTWALSLGASLNNFTYVESSGGTLSTTLTVGQYFYDSSDTGVKFWTRLYNPPSISGSELHPGPLLYIRRGDSVTVTLVNTLGPESGTMTTLNSFHYPNTTNLHTHGLHVSAESPQDNILMTVSPGGSYAYTYEIPDDHAGGTFWYHAHHHGSTSCQVGGGLLGVIIVADGPSDLPSAFVGMDEVVLLFAELQIGDLVSRYLSATGDHLFSHEDNEVGNGDSFMLVNGQYEPTASMVKGRWTRFRMVFSSLTNTLELKMTSNTIGCEWHLLAKDGIYVAQAPRALGSTIYFAPGNRVDVVARCSNTGTFVLGSDSDATILSVEVQANVGDDDAELPRFNPYRPDYLADVYTSSTATEYEINFQGSPGGCAINGNAWDGSTALSTMVTGSIQKWRARGSDRHPFHLHVNSYQLQGVTDASGFFVEGDWHDVIHPPTGVTVAYHYFSVDSFRTKSILHCHFLPHEDLGCMGYIQHTGVEGATTGLSGSSMSCTGASTGADTYTSACVLEGPTPTPTTSPTEVGATNAPTAAPTPKPSAVPTAAPTAVPTSENDGGSGSSDLLLTFVLVGFAGLILVVVLFVIAKLFCLGSASVAPAPAPGPPMPQNKYAQLP